MRSKELNERISGTLLKGGIFAALCGPSLKYLCDAGKGGIF
jgi:hypothetical protein